MCSTAQSGIKLLGLNEAVHLLAMSHHVYWDDHVSRMEDGHVIRREDGGVLRRALEIEV